jgi:hypothetical protein
MPWRLRINAIKLQRENDALGFELIRVREKLRNAEGYNCGLEVLLIERLKRIDELQGRLDQSRQQVKRLEAEAEHLAELVRLAPPVDAAMLPK